MQGLVLNQSVSQSAMEHCQKGQHAADLRLSFGMRILLFNLSVVSMVYCGTCKLVKVSLVHQVFIWCSRLQNEQPLER